MDKVLRRSRILVKRMRMEAAWFRPEIPPRSYQFPVEFETHLN
jgi:hypothetical protein